MADDVKKGFKIWIPRVRTPKYSIKIDGVNVTTEVVAAEFTNGIFGVESPCKLSLTDADGTYARLYTGGETIEFLYDFTTGTRSQWKGTLDLPKRKFGATYSLELVGSHYQSDTLDITVTAEFKEVSADNILKNVFAKYLPTFTVNNVASSATLVTITWNNKPLYDCIVELCEIAGFDCYVDSDKDVHFFEQESIVNASDAVIWNDTMIENDGFGSDDTDIKNRIIVYGEDNNGLPIIYQADDDASQTANGLKEKPVKDSSVKTYEQAKNLGDGLLAQEKEKANKGEFECLLLPFITPGDMVWITNPVQDVHTTSRLIKYTHKIPIERSALTFYKDKTIPTLFKERKKVELAQENIVNPFTMQKTLNLNFDLDSDFDATASSDITIGESKLRIVTGKGSGVMVSKRRTESSNITSVYLKIVGEVLAGNTYYVSANDGGDWEQINLEQFTSLTSVGTNLRLKINLTDTNTRIDSVCLMYK